MRIRYSHEQRHAGSADQWVSPTCDGQIYGPAGSLQSGFLLPCFETTPLSQDLDIASTVQHTHDYQMRRGGGVIDEIGPLRNRPHVRRDGFAFAAD